MFLLDVNKLKNKRNKYIFLLGLILFSIGLATSNVSLSIIDQPLDVYLHAKSMSSVSWTGNTLTIDLSKATPSGVSSATYSIYIKDNIARRIGDVVYEGVVYTLTIKGNGQGYITASPTHVVEYYGVAGQDINYPVLAGVTIVHTFNWQGKKVVFNIKEHQVLIEENSTILAKIPLLKDFTPKEISWDYGGSIYPAFSGEIHVYGGHTRYSLPMPTHTTSPRSPSNSTTTTLVNTPSDTNTSQNSGSWLIIIGGILVIMAFIL